MEFKQTRNFIFCVGPTFPRKQEVTIFFFVNVFNIKMIGPSPETDYMKAQNT